MRKAVIICCIAIASFIILGQSGVLTSLLFFLLVGAIPGTDYAVPSTLMLVIIVSIIWLIIFRFTALEAYYSTMSKRSIKPSIAHKKRMPKRRFSQV